MGNQLKQLRVKGVDLILDKFHFRMSQADDFGDDEYATAIAAVAFAIASLEEEDSQKHVRVVKGSRSSRTTIKHNKEVNCAVLDNDSTKKNEEAEQGTSSNNQGTENATRCISTFWEIPVSAESSNQHEGHNYSSTLNRATSPPPQKSWDGTLVEYKKLEQTDAWGNKELAKIENRYENRNASIQKWENGKKTSAKRQLEKKERGLQQRQEKATQEYRDEMLWIDKMASGARAAADEKKRNEESRVREKARAMRSTKKGPRTCFCF